MVFCEYFEVQIRIGWSLRVSDALRCNRGRWEVPNTNAVFHTKGGGGGEEELTAAAIGLYG